MIRIKLSQLENARLDPKSFGQSLVAGQTGLGYNPPYSKFRTWGDAVLRYHAYGSDQSAETKAADFFEKKFRRYKDSKANKREYIKMLSQLGDYIKAFEDLQVNFQEARKNVVLDFDDYVCFGGQIQYLYMSNEGRFGAIYFAKKEFEWKSELRFPIIQKIIADEVYGGDTEGVDVGYYFLAENKFEIVSYDLKEIKLAEDELNGIGNTVSDIVKAHISTSK